MQRIYINFNAFKLWNNLILQSLKCFFMSFLVVFFSDHVQWPQQGYNLEEFGAQRGVLVIEEIEVIIFRSLECLKT